MEQLDAVLAHAPACCLVSLHDGCLLYANGSWKKLVPDADVGVDTRTQLTDVYQQGHGPSRWIERYHPQGAWITWSHLTRVAGLPQAAFGTIIPGLRFERDDRLRDHALLEAVVKSMLEMDELSRDFEQAILMQQRAATRMRELKQTLVNLALISQHVQFTVSVAPVIDIAERGSH